jgi:hypothetical protein
MAAHNGASGARNTNLTMARWLLIVAALVVLIVVVGGITRLTESGLSITEWKPQRHCPPLTEAPGIRNSPITARSTNMPPSMRA